MACYYLLRNNQELGPYFLSELKAMPLFSTDLIWLEGESKCWKHPAEFEALKASIREPETRQHITRKTSSDFVSQNLYAPVTGSAAASSFRAQNKAEELAEEPVDYTPSFEELKRKYAERAPQRKSWKIPVNLGANLFGLATLVLGVMAAAVMIKKAVDNIDFEPMVATAQAQAIDGEKLPQSSSKHAAFAAVAPPLAQANMSATPAVMKEVTQTNSAVATKTTEQVDALEKPVADSETQHALPDTDETVRTAPAKTEEKTTDVAEVPKPEEKKPADTKPADKPAEKAGLQIAANDYSVGLFGGISNLELTVSNPSSKSVDKATIAVDFLKPNGKVVGTETVEVSGLAAGASKKISVPNSSRGVKVRYRVAN